MLVLWLTSTLRMPNGNQFCAPIGVEDASMEAFVERLNDARVVMVTGLALTPPDQFGVQTIREEWPFALGVSGVGTIQNNRFRVCRAVDDEEAA